jgi:tRNA threonylcarbamoyl adenosine modification protein YeaZ
MNYLAIDTSGKNLTVIICKDGKITEYYDSECGVNHSVALMPKIEEIAQSAQFDFNKADFFCAVVGAGSFTGIRIGVSTIKAMCFAFNKPCLSITSFDTLAYNKQGKKVLALIDAKHNGFYACGYDNAKVVLQPCYIDRTEVEQLLTEYHGVSSTAVNGLDLELVNISKGLINAIEKKVDEVSADLESLSPLYVRKSQAEEGR